jgi:hypothetical protein
VTGTGLDHALGPAVAADAAAVPVPAAAAVVPVQMADHIQCYAHTHLQQQPVICGVRHGQRDTCGHTHGTCGGTYSSFEPVGWQPGMAFAAHTADTGSGNKKKNIK